MAGRRNDRRADRKRAGFRSVPAAAELPIVAEAEDKSHLNEEP